MQSPFIELPEVQPEQPFAGEIGDALLANSPFELPQTEWAYEDVLTERQVPITVNWQEKARQNAVYAVRLGWSKNLEAIRAQLSRFSGAVTNDYRSEAFAKAVALWQLANGFKMTDADGVIGPNTYRALTKAPVITAPVTRPRSKWHSIIPDARRCAVTPLVDGKETFEAMVRAMTNTKAGDFIYIMGWMIDTNFEMTDKVPLFDVTGAKIPCTLANVLTQAAERKVKIRVLIWSNPGYTTEISVAQAMINRFSDGRMLIDKATYGSKSVQDAQAVLKIALDQTMARIPFPFDKALASTSKWKKINAYASLTNEGSHHEKVIIVKSGADYSAFCGGIDLNPNRIPGAPDSEGRSRVPHDVHCMLGGHGAWELLKRFHRRWESCREFLRAARINTDPTYDLTPLPIEPGEAAPGTGISYTKIFHTYNKWDGSVQERTIKDTIRQVIDQAERHVYIEDQYMVSCEIAGWLNAKLRKDRNFKVDIHTQDDEFAKEDMQIPKRKRDEFIRKLKEGALNPANVSISIYTPKTPLLAHHQMHSKLYVVDTSLMIIGSANCNRRSMQLDSETAAFIFDDEAVSDPRLVSTFLDNFNKKDADSWMIDYKANPAVDDLDTEIATVAKIAFAGVAIGSPLLFWLVSRLTSDLATNVLSKFWEVIDPNPDKIACDVPPDVSKELVSEEWLEAPPEFAVSAEGVLTELSEGEVGIPDFLSPEKSRLAIKSNQAQIVKSGVPLADVLAALAKNVDLTNIRTQMTAWNVSQPARAYAMETNADSIGAVFTEAVHQFQIMNYLDPKEQDGVAGMSTFDTLGFTRHGLHPQLASSGFYGQQQLNRSDVRSLVGPATNNEFTNANWYTGMIYPAWLGVRISSGVHVLLHRKLKEAENWLKSQPQYKGLTPAALGKALGFTSATRYSAARLSADKQAMHGFGLAIDINVEGNPWLGAGWIQGSPEATQMLMDLRNAAPGQTLNGSTVLSYLHNIATAQGTDTSAAYTTLKQRSTEFVSYLSTHSSQLAYWRKSYTFGGRNPLNGFLNLHHDLVVALRQIAGLAWGAIDFGPGASGDVMHFDLRTSGVGKILCQKIGGYVPKAGHPTIQTEFNDYAIENTEGIAWETMTDSSEVFETAAQWETDPDIHEAVEEAYQQPEVDSEEYQETVIAQEAPADKDLGRLLIDTSIPVLRKSFAQYQFTSSDAVWLARFVEGEAGGRDNAENHAVIWAMFNRFGMLRHAVPSWKTFGTFLRRYSTTLQPLLNSVGAAKRVWQNHQDHPQQFPVVSVDSTYPGTDIKRVQYKRHIDLQQKSWDSFSAVVRGMVIRIMTGQIPNPGIGIATHFGSTMVYLKTSRRNRKISGEPTYEEWKQYTLQYAKQQNWIWIGEKSNLNQAGNAFFIQERFRDIPAGAVRVEFGGGISQEYVSDELFEDRLMGDEHLDNEEYFPGEIVGEETGWARAVSQNRNYASMLGWNQYYEQISNFLLPYAGLQNVSLSEEAFAQAAAAWQQQQGLTADGIIGPRTWAVLQPLIQSSVPVTSPSQVGSPPSQRDVLAFNRWHAQKILDSISAGVVAVNTHLRLNPLTQLQQIAAGQTVIRANPSLKLLQALPLISHICEQARINSYREIMIGSFIREPDSDGSCSGHCEGRCIDINFTGGSFTNSGAVQMVINILSYLNTLPASYKRNLGFGLPLQGDFFGNKALNKFHSVPVSNLVNLQLRQLIPPLGYVFPDNENHMHIQVRWI